MGWLRDLMDGASPPVRSYGALARAALAHPDWPPDTRAQPRSLSALFSKLDRDQELDWLADRPGVRIVLAELLGAPAASLERRFETAIAETDRSRGQVRLDDVPFARVIDLTSEPLPPGIPSLVLQPPRWERVYWHAPSGSGRSLVGSWLAARGLAAHVEALEWHDATGSISQSGALFVELHSGRDATSVLRAPPRAPLCIASPIRIDRKLLEQAGFTLVTSPPADSIAVPLIQWLEPRLPPHEHFDRTSAAAFLERAIGAGQATSLGDLLGLLGSFDELGPREAGRRTFDELASRFVRQRLGLDKRRGERRPAWHADAFDILVGLARRALTDSQLPWEAPRTLADWAALVPPEWQRAIDPEWLRVSLGKTASSSTLKEVERALSDLPPGGYRVVSALAHTGLLRPSAGREMFRPAPQWIASLVSRRARRTLLAGSAFEWGEALVEPTLARDVFEELLARARRDADGVIDDVLELGASSSSAHAAAVESVLRAVGLLLLSGDIEPPEALDELWDAALELSIEIGGCARPRVPMPPDGGSLLSDGAYLAAMLACSEALSSRQGRRHVQLRPWLVPRPERPVPIMNALLEAAEDADPGDVGWVPHAVALVSRLLASIDEAPTQREHASRHEAPGCSDDSDARNGSDGSGAPSVHDVEVPYRIARAIASDSLAWPLCRRALERPWLIRALDRVLTDNGIDWRRASRAIFEAWRDNGYPETALLGAGSRTCEPLWQSAPLTIWSRALIQGTLPIADVPWQHVPEAAWHALVFEHPEVARAAAPWRGADAARVRAALTRSLPSGDGAAALWQEHGAEALLATGKHLEAGTTGVMQFAREVSTEHVPAVLELLGRFPAPPSDRDPERSFLHALIARRHADWRTAYALLAERERSAGRGRSPGS